jgi:low temperature requirement protein LtrA
MKPVDIGRCRLRAAGPQPVMFVELFFDLVFVFAVTQVTILTAHHLTPDGIPRSMLLFWLIWWAWTQFTWTLNPADTTHGAVRVITLVATGAAFIMATAVPRAFEEDAIWFAVPYVVVGLLGLALQLKVDNDGPDVDTQGARVWASLSAVGLVLVIAGAVADPTLRVWLWVLVIGADLVAATFAGQTQEESHLDPAHFSERHALFVIIALGESLIVAGTAMAAEARTGVPGRVQPHSFPPDVRHHRFRFRRRRRRRRARSGRRPVRRVLSRGLLAAVPPHPRDPRRRARGDGRAANA